MSANMNATTLIKQPKRIGTHQSECDGSGQLHEQNRGWRDVALAECQRAFVPKSHEGKKQGETSPGYEAQPLRRQRYRPLACR